MISAAREWQVCGSGAKGGSFAAKQLVLREIYGNSVGQNLQPEGLPDALLLNGDLAYRLLQRKSVLSAKPSTRAQRAAPHLLPRRATLMTMSRTIQVDPFKLLNLPSNLF